MNIGIVGQGFVGNAVYQKFKLFYNVLTYDLNKKLCNSTFDNVAKKCKIIFICLPTPMNKSNGSCNISIIDNILNDLNNKNKKILILIKSTIPPHTTFKLNNKYSNLNINFNPEFLTEANAVSDYNNQKRIIIGSDNNKNNKIFYFFNIVFNDAKIIQTSSINAEILKYTTNAFLSVKVSFANEIYSLCKEVGSDYTEVIEMLLMDKRIGKSHWRVPGPDGDFGYGGHCFPKDLSELIFFTDKNKTPNNVLKGTKSTNDQVRKNKDWESMEGRAVI